MTIQKIASVVKTVFALNAATRTAATYTSAAFALSSYGYPRKARAIVSATIDGGGTVDAYLTDDSTGSHTKITGSDITQITATGWGAGPEVAIRSGATEVKLVIVHAVATEESAGVIEMGQLAYAS